MVLVVVRERRHEKELGLSIDDDLLEAVDEVAARECVELLDQTLVAVRDLVRGLVAEECENILDLRDALRVGGLTVDAVVVKAVDGEVDDVDSRAGSRELGHEP